MEIKDFIKTYLKETADIALSLNQDQIEKMCQILMRIKEQGGRVFFIGVGGGAATGSHACNDFNKIAGIAAICLTDNIGLLTALTNDEGWDSVFQRQLEMNRLNEKDCLFIYSVGGGTEKVSRNLVLAINYAKKIGSKIIGVVGRPTGATAKEADACVVVFCASESLCTPHTEDFQLVMDHLIANVLNKISKENHE